jgi:hypothetical protein
MKKIFYSVLTLLLVSVSTISAQFVALKRKQSAHVESKQQCVLRNNTCSELLIECEILSKRNKKDEVTLAVHGTVILRVKKQRAVQIRWKNQEGTILYMIPLNSIPSEVRIYESGMVYIDGKFTDAKRTKIITAKE